MRTLCRVDAVDEPEAQAGLAFLTIRLIGRLRAHHVARLAVFGLSIPEANVLLNLHPGRAMPMRQLADLMAYDKSNLTGVMRRLEARKLVTADASGTYVGDEARLDLPERAVDACRRRRLLGPARFAET
jgi:hypothetical protein